MRTNITVKIRKVAASIGVLVQYNAGLAQLKFPNLIKVEFLQ